MQLRTTDITLTATLLCQGHKLQKITKDENRGTFHFLDVPEAAMTEFDLGKTLVEPNEFNRHMRGLNATMRAMP